jgi:soluble lytic murein transglycosylase
VQAREAFRRNDQTQLRDIMAILNTSGGHILGDYVEYWQYRTLLSDKQISTQAPLPLNEIRQFLNRTKGSLLADMARRDLLVALARKKNWQAVDEELAQLTPAANNTEEDYQTRCLRIATNLALKPQTPQTSNDTSWVLMQEKSAGEACMMLTEWLVQQQKWGAPELWQRMRRQMELGNLNTVKWLADVMSNAGISNTIGDNQLEMLYESPAQWIKTQNGLRTQNGNALDTKQGTRKELHILAYARLAKSDPEAVLGWLESQGDALLADDRQYLVGQIAVTQAKKGQLDALTRYQTLLTPIVTYAHSDEVWEWGVRSGLRMQDWKSVKLWIDKMPTRLKQDPAWRYWYGRALQQEGQIELAKQQWQAMLTPFNFYGQLAYEELGLPVAIPARTNPVTPEELNAALINPGFERAIQWLKLGFRADANKEWQFTLRGMTDRQLLASAEYARRLNILDRAISSAERTQAEHDLSLRFLAPHREAVQQQSRAINMDESWVYGLMRQESRFMTDAKSSVGASGLMQLMPATAAMVAKKIGLDLTNGVQDVQTNIMLGTTYLKMVHDGAGGSLVMATAAYNAGPGRPKAWRTRIPFAKIEGAIFAETIPFTETRDYVKKVMSNTTLYGALFDGRVTPLKQRLGSF